MDNILKYFDDTKTIYLSPSTYNNLNYDINNQNIKGTLDTNNNNFDFVNNNNNGIIINENKSPYNNKYEYLNLNNTLYSNNSKNTNNSNYDDIFKNWDNNSRNIKKIKINEKEDWIEKLLNSTLFDTNNTEYHINNQNKNINLNINPISPSKKNIINKEKKPISNHSNQIQFTHDNQTGTIKQKENNLIESNPIGQIPGKTNPIIPEKDNPEKKKRNVPIPVDPIPVEPKPLAFKYYFHFKGLDNIGSTCYMNSTLQCLLHLSSLISYFINEYPKDFNKLKEKNKNVSTEGNISKVLYDLIKKVYPQKDNEKKTLDNNALINNYNSYNYSNTSESISPFQFQQIIGKYNPQFQNLEANDSKDLILYLLQSMHSELNYWSDNKINYWIPNQFDRANSFNFFINTYDKQNFSIISRLFYGTYENITKCRNCFKIIYNFQKFEFISFGMRNYAEKDFNIYNGFEDNQKVQLLTGDNQFYCNSCKKLCDAEICTKIIVPPNYFLINIDYGKNKLYMPRTIKFDEEINITKYVNFNFGTEIKYQLIGLCTHYGISGIYGHYVAFCKNKKNDKWYLFNDSFCQECDKNSIYNGTPYLLLYERIF